MSEIEEAMYTSLVMDERLIAMRGHGYTDAEICRITGQSRTSLIRRIGKRGPRSKATRKTMHGISVSPLHYESAKVIATQLGLLQRTGSRVGEGSVGRLVEEIGAGRVIVKKANDKDLANLWLHMPDGEGGTVSDGGRDDDDRGVDTKRGEEGIFLYGAPLGQDGDYEEEAETSDRTHPEAL